MTVMKEVNDLIIAAKKISEAVNNLPPDLSLSNSVRPRVMIVGGFVRDTLRGSNPKDADVEVFGVGSDKLVEVLQELFGSESVNEVGKSFGVIKVALPGGLELDVSIPRIDSRGVGAGHKDIEVKGDPNLSIIEAQRRRDFTINALSMDVLSGEIIDSFGGKEDLQKGILRLVDEKTFKDDPLRVMRGVQFVARFGLTVEPKTFSFMKEMVANGALDHLPAERICGEMEKLLTKSEKPSVGLELMRDLGILERHFPELNNMIGCEQDPFFHPEGDVWIHTKLVVDAAAMLFEKRFPCPSETAEGEYKKIKFSVMLGALLHDVGKLSVTKRGDDGKIHSFDHETAGIEPARAFLKRLNVSEEVLDVVLRIVRLHSLPGDQGELFFAGKMSEDQYKKATKRFLDRLQLDQNRSFPWQAFLVVCEADYFGCNPKKDKPPFRQLAEITRIISELKKPFGPVIQGQEVLTLWREIKGEDRPGGPWVGEITKIINEEGHYDPAEAMARVKEIIKTM
jgi:tRNA nucleotidyltransferase (CCA-adding enzyme)